MTRRRSMKRYLVPVFCGVFLFTGWIAVEANAQTTAAEAQAHVAKAKAVAYRPDHDISDTFDSMCYPLRPNATQISGAPSPGPTAPRSREPHAWWAAPAKVFDNLYYVGTSNQNNQSVWAVTTSDGIILIDSAYDYTVKELVTNGLKKIGLDPAQIKYVILHHAHGDRYFGSKYLQDTYHARLIMSEADWNVVAKSNDPAELKPRKDLVATDGMKLTLGDTTLTLYITPGHTPGSLSVLVPLKDGNERHVGAVWGGINPDVGRNGVRYFANMEETFKTWSASAKRFQDIAAKANADVYLTLHPFYDKALDKLHALNFRKPGGPHPFVSKDNLNRFLTIIRECTEAQLASISS